MTDGQAPLGIAGVVARAFVDSKLTPVLALFAVGIGLFATVRLPREEEPQIVVPMVDIFVEMPGASPQEVDARLTTPLEQRLWEVPGVEYIYTTSSPGQAMLAVRFHVGEDEENAVVRLTQKLSANADLIPPEASPPVATLRSIDDVPVLALTLSSDRYGDYELRRIAAQVRDAVTQTPGVSVVDVIGGQRRAIQVELDESRLAASGLSAVQVARSLVAANRSRPTGAFDENNQRVLLETGQLLTGATDVEEVVIGAYDGQPLYVRDVADVLDGGEEPARYVRFASKQDPSFQPAVTLAVSKRRGANAIDVANRVLAKFEGMRADVLPSDINVAVTRHYGQTAEDKSNELLGHMMTAIIAVSLLIWLTLGFRESWIVFLAIPATLFPTLACFYLYGYTLNRITLFALIFSIGILVDDAIVVVENIARHMRMAGNRGRAVAQIAVEAVAEVGNPSILATFTIIAAVLPMAFVSGLMGPYMEPIPVGAASAVTISTLVAFTLTPWAAVRFLRPRSEGEPEEREDWTTRLYRRVMVPLLHRPVVRYGFLVMIVVLLVAAMALVGGGWVKVKMLPFDNKSEFQVIVDLPEGTSLERTARVTQQLAERVLDDPDVLDVQTYAGSASPYNFNGLVRHYFLRGAPHEADIQVNLTSQDERDLQSHDIATRVREVIAPLAAELGARITVAEVPPGPPVQQTLVAEVYGPTAEGRARIAADVREVLESTDGVVDVDWSVEDPQPKLRLVVDDEKAALHGISVAEIVEVLDISAGGRRVGPIHDPQEKDEVPLILRLERSARSSSRLLQLRIPARDGALIPVSELVSVESVIEDQSISHKNLMPVTYVTADVAGAIESPVYAMLEMQPRVAEIETGDGSPLEQLTASLPTDGERFTLKWDGEWYITYEVFRDLGLAFAAVMVLIYVLLVGWFKSFATPLVIMSAIPFSLIGILPAHGLLGAFFTATSMIGFIAGAGIVIRNSIILVDFIELRRGQGMPLDEAVIEAGAVRFRPMMLTASSLIVGAAVMLFDPIFQGLAISLMAGEVASLLLSRMTVPIVYYLTERRHLA
jgi:multidrug efflux pump subunit AcrB